MNLSSSEENYEDPRDFFSAKRSSSSSEFLPPTSIPPKISRPPIIPRRNTSRASSVGRSSSILKPPAKLPLAGTDCYGGDKKDRVSFETEVKPLITSPPQLPERRPSKHFF